MTKRGKVKGRTLSSHGSVIGTCNDNPLLNALTHDVEFEDRDVRECVANVIGENMLARADADGHVTMVFQATLHRRKNDAARELKDKHFYMNNQKKLRKSTQG